MRWLELYLGQSRRSIWWVCICFGPDYNFMLSLMEVSLVKQRYEDVECLLNRWHNICLCQVHPHCQLSALSSMFFLKNYSICRPCIQSFWYLWNGYWGARFLFKMNRHVCLRNRRTDIMLLKCSKCWTWKHFEIRNNSIEHWTVISDGAQLFHKTL